MTEQTHEGDRTAFEIYLNDHLAGGTGAIELAERMAERNDGTELGAFLDKFVAEITEDHEMLRVVIERLGLEVSGLKQAGAWLGEKLTAVKLGRDEGLDSVTTLLGLEALAVGVRGKILLWQALQAVSDRHAALSSVDFAGLLDRAEAQRSALEERRLAAARSTFG